MKVGIKIRRQILYLAQAYVSAAIAMLYVTSDYSRAAVVIGGSVLLVNAMRCIVHVFKGEAP